MCHKSWCIMTEPIKLKTRTIHNCKFCGTVCKNFLDHLKKYHKKQIKTEYFPKTEKGAASFFKLKEMPDY